MTVNVHLKKCEGKINQFGMCDTCYQPSLCTSGYCDRLIPFSPINSSFWEPTCLLRWKIKPIDFDPINTTKVLQQMWKGDKGDFKWQDIEIAE